LNYIISFSFLIIKVKKDKTKLLNTWDLIQFIFRWPIACLSFFFFIMIKSCMAQQLNPATS